MLRWWKTATIENQSYLLPSSRDEIKKASDYEITISSDLQEDVWAVVDLVHAKGYELFVLNQTRPDIGMPVVKVIVPGMRHFWARFAPGRLYQTPVELGWLEAPLLEEELNPIPMFV